jgi:phospholipase C
MRSSSAVRQGFTMISRRNLLQAGKNAAFSAAALAAFPPSIRRALAILPTTLTGTVADVQHVVILMQENRLRPVLRHTQGARLWMTG